MKRYAAIETLFSKTDLTFAQSILNEPFHPTGPVGRPPRNPLGVFKAHIVKRLKHIPSDRMLVARAIYNIVFTAGIIATSNYFSLTRALFAS
jgi:hypothetical protein